MSEADSRRYHLIDPKLAAFATSALPTWFWNTEATRLLWANPVGTAILGGRSPAELSRLGAQVSRFSATLPFSGAARLQRLSGLAAGIGRMLLCHCSRIELADRTRGFLIAAAEPAGPPLPLGERVRRLYESGAAAVSVFTPDGSPLYATDQARTLLGEISTLAMIGAEQLGREALHLGHSVGKTVYGPVSINRLGLEAATVLVATFLTPPMAESASAIPPAPTVAAPPSIAPPIAQEPRAAKRAPTTSDVPTAPAADVVMPPPVELPSAWTTSETTVVESPEVAPLPPNKVDAPLRERRHPLRFVWQMDVDGRFTLGSDEFTEVIGPDIAATLGRRWSDVAAELALDPEGQVARAVEGRDTWSGITVSWPVDGGDRLTVELSGLPIYDRSRTFLGYRGFGVCRDIESIAALMLRRRNGYEQGQRPVRDARSVEIPLADITSSRRAPTERPALTIVPAAENVVPFPTPAQSAEQKAANPIENNAFRELTRQLSARLQDGEESDAQEATPVAPAEVPMADLLGTNDFSFPAVSQEPPVDPGGQVGTGLTEHPLLERLPVGILVYRLDKLLYGNRAFLEWTGYQSLEALSEAGGLGSLFIESGADTLGDAGGLGKTLTITTSQGDKIPAEGRLFSVPWDGEIALVLMLINAMGNDRRKATDAALRASEADTAMVNAILDVTTDGIVVLDGNGSILSANRGAESLFGCAGDELKGSFGDLFAPESQRAALDQLAFADQRDAVPPDVVADECEVTGRTRVGGAIALHMRIRRIAGDSVKFCVALQDLGARKRLEAELLDTRQRAEKTVADKSEFLAKISHEIRTPLNSIVGFSEIMLEERFGPIGNERYRDYLKDIRTSGTHVISLLNDLIDLSKIEVGQLELSPVSVNLNELVHSCVTQMQPHASRERIIIRMSLSPALPPLLADSRSVRQMIVNLLNNSIRFTRAGGQVIVSTALSDADGIVLRVRDTGIGMSDTDVEAALDPFRRTATRSAWGATGSGLGLSLTKALAEANRARFSIVSKVDDGTLVEIIFPSHNG